MAVHLRNILGTQTLSEIMSERDRTIKSLIEEISKTTEPWGVRHALAPILPTSDWLGILSHSANRMAAILASVRD